MAAPTENEFYKLRLDLSEDGRKLSRKEVIEKSQEYIDYCRNVPLESTDFRGKDAIPVNIKHVRAMSIEGLCHWLGITKPTWHEWRKDEKYSSICTRVEQVMYSQKFEGAAAGLLTPSIIARDLGLKEQSESETKITGKDIKIEIEGADPDDK